jgi:uncharacterized damage-inducible protein DinB
MLGCTFTHFVVLNLLDYIRLRNIVLSDDSLSKVFPTERCLFGILARNVTSPGALTTAVNFSSSNCYNSIDKTKRSRRCLMDAKELLLRSLEESYGYLTKALDGLTQEESTWSPSPESNSISFILWHMTRVEDFFVNRVIQRGKELYETKNWQERLGTPTKAYQYTVEELQAWPAPKLEVLIKYAASVRESTLAFLNSIPPGRLSEVPRPERSPDSIGVMLGHVSTEIAMHAGQIAYIRGIMRGLDK